MKVQELRKRLQDLFREKSFEGFNTNFSDAQFVNKGICFFPYGRGLLTDGEDISKDSVLFLGSDWGSIADNDEYVKANNEGLFTGEKNPTNSNIVNLLTEKNKEDKVFLSNIFMGLRTETDSNIQSYSYVNNKDYQRLCKEFLSIQLEQITPRKIVALGNRVEAFLNKHFKGTEFLKIPHPSMLHTNLSQRLTKENGVKASSEEIRQEIERIKKQIWE